MRNKMKTALYWKFILSPKEQHQGPQLKVSSKGLSLEIDILIRSPVPVITDAAVAYSIVLGS